MGDIPKQYQSLVRLCRAFHSRGDLQAAFRHAAEELHPLVRCDRVSLTLPSGQPGTCHGYAVEFDGPPRWSQPPGDNAAAPAAGWVLEHRRPRFLSHRDPAGALADERDLFDQGYRAVAHLPLVCRDEVVGVLGLAGRQDDPLGGWDREFLEALAGLLALALDGLAARERVAELERFRQESAYLREESKTDRDLRQLTGDSPAMKAVRLAVRQVASTDSTVLVLGETGTGKELVARAIHQLGPRRERLLVTINCAALAPGVLASELFGHEQGAFTGATRRRVGRFELAHRGTLFLDEVGELPPETQVMLLRVLQERVIERVGGQGPIPVDVRVVAATHQDLAAAMSQGRFRADLFFRLNVFPIHVPPLRERREDIPDLVRHFLLRFGRRMNRPGTRVSPAGLKLLTEYHWPGNVRELENLIERALIVGAGDVLEIDPRWLSPARPEDAAAPSGLAEVERRAILDALARCGGRIYGPGGAAAALGLKPTTLYGKMRKLDIPRDARPS